MPGDDETRAQGPGSEGSGGSKFLDVTVAPLADHDLLAQLRRRRAGSRRLPALCCGHRDTFDCLVRPVGPSTFSLAPEQLSKHANDLAASGWPIEEIVSVLAIDPVRPTS